MRQVLPGRLIIVCGLPGAGKTTHAKRLETVLGAVRLSPDEWLAHLGANLWDEQLRARIEALQWSLARDLLRAGLIVVLEWGTWARLERDVLRRGARALGAGVELHYLAAPLEVLIERVEARGSEEPPITRADMERWVALFEVPDAEELAMFDASSL